MISLLLLGFVLAFLGPKLGILDKSFLLWFDSILSLEIGFFPTRKNLANHNLFPLLRMVSN